MIATLDPDVEWCGLAIGHGHRDSFASIVWLDLARVVNGCAEVKGLSRDLRHLPEPVDRIVCEIPDSVRVNARDLFACLAEGAALAGVLSAMWRCPIEWRVASAWTGTIQKSMREARTQAALRSSERVLLERIPKSYRSEALSAAGLWMHEAGRTVRGGGLSGR